MPMGRIIIRPRNSIPSILYIDVKNHPHRYSSGIWKARSAGVAFLPRWVAA